MASKDAPVGGQAVLEGVMMRGVSTWAVAVRTPQGEIDVTASPLTSWLKRHRALRLPLVRGVVALAESLKIGFSALQISANKQLEGEGEEPEEIGKGAWIGTMVLALALAVGLFFVVPVGLTSLIKDQLDSSIVFWLVEGIVRTAIFLGYLVVISRLRGPAPGLRVPRRGAQDDRLLRGGRAAHAGQRRPLQPPAPALRHELLADRDDRGDLRLRADRAARVVDPRPDPDRRRAASSPGSRSRSSSGPVATAAAPGSAS